MEQGKSLFWRETGSRSVESDSQSEDKIIQASEMIFNILGNCETWFSSEEGNVFSGSLDIFRSKKIFEISLWSPEDENSGWWIIRTVPKLPQKLVIDNMGHLEDCNRPEECVLFRMHKDDDFVEAYSSCSEDVIPGRFPNVFSLLKD